MACHPLTQTISKCHSKLSQYIFLFIKVSSFLNYFNKILNKILLITLYLLQFNKVIDFIFWFINQFTIKFSKKNILYKVSIKQSSLNLIAKCSNLNFYGLQNNQKNIYFMYLKSFISFLYVLYIKKRKLLDFNKCPLHLIIFWINSLIKGFIEKGVKCFKEKCFNEKVFKKKSLISLIFKEKTLIEKCVIKLNSFLQIKFEKKILSENLKLNFVLFMIYSNNLILPVNCNFKVSVPGDILLGGLFPVHQKGNKPEISSFNSTNQTTLCGPINKDRGIQRVEAMLFALDKINQNEKILPTIKLGAIILDTCASDTYALNQSLEFIRASVNTVESSAFECADNSTPKSRYKTKIITGVVGGSYSEVSLQVANLLRLFRIPQVSYASTTTSLSDKTRYDFFARTVPPDKYQARTLVDLVAYFNWSYVSIVSSEGQYGDSGLIAFIRSARNRNICIAANEKVTHSANTSSFDQIFESLLAKPNAKGVVLFLRMEDARGLLLAAKRANRVGMFTWIAADGWGKELKLVENVEEIALGAITVELQSETIHEFDQYFKKLRLFPPVVSKNDIDKSEIEDYIINNRNPWFRDYWQEVFECQLPKETKLSQTLANYDDLMLSDQPNSDSLKYENFYEFLLLTAYKQGDYELLEKLSFFENFHGFNKSFEYPSIYEKPKFLNDKKYLKKLYLNKQFLKKYVKNRSKRFIFQKDQRPLCSSHLSLRDVHHKQEPKIQFVVDAVYAFAHALHNAWSIKCNATGKICQALRDLDGGEFYNNYLLNVSFLDSVGSLVRFDSNGDGLGRYNVYNFQRSNTSATNFTYKRIGSWSDNGLKLNVSDIYWNIRRLPHDLIPTSRCSEPCGIGEIKITQSTSETCCWICQQCKSYEFVSSKGKCEDCGVGFWPLINKTACYELPITYIKWTSYYALVPIVLAILGIFLTLFVIITFLKHMDTPIVKASGRELSFILLFGLVWCFSMTFFLLAPPTVYICALQRFGIGFGFSIVYGSLLTKTNRISRIFNSARNSAKRPSFISPRSQVILTLALVSIQVIETVIWFILEEPGVKKDVTEEKRWLVTLKCRAKDTSTLFSLAYNMLLITTCTAYAFKTRKIPENFNESKFIGFTMYTTCIIWLAFVPIFFGTGNSHEIQITTLCTSISLSAYVTLFCLFSPKIYIIIFHPDKNVRKLTMNSNTHKKSAISSGIYFPTNQDTGINANLTRHQITVEQYSSQSSTNDSLVRNQNSNSSNKKLKTGFITTSNDLDENIKIDDQVCSKKKNAKENDKNLFNPSNQLSVMMFVPGFNPVPINRLDSYSNNSLQGYELRKRSNSFTQGQTINFLPNLEVNNDQINHHHRILYQAPFFFNNEVAQQTLNYYKNENDSIINQSKQSNETKLLNSNELNETANTKNDINQLNENQVTVELLSQRSFVIENDKKDEESQI